MVIIKLFKEIKKVITWHLLPTPNDLSLKSVVESLFYLLITIILLGVFYYWHVVPERNIVIVIEKTQSTKYVKVDSTEGVNADINLTMPLTNKKYDNCGHFKVDIQFDKYTKSKDRESVASFIDTLKINDLARSLHDSIDMMNNTKWWGAFYKRRPYIENMRNFYFSIAFNRGPNSVSSGKIESVIDKKFDEYNKDTLLMLNVGEYLNDVARFKCLSAKDSLNFSINQEWDNSDVMGKPAWYRFEDISQSYFNIRLNTLTMDSMTLKINFVGAADFSNMIPEPDVIGMGNIEFNEPAKIRKIGEDGLQFHAKFRELENMQTIRLLGITTVLGGIVFVFVGILFIGTYHFCRRLNWKRVIAIFAIILLGAICFLL